MIDFKNATARKNQKYCVMDYETYSEADLTKVGAYEYSIHPSTEILCVAWRIGTLETLKSERTYCSNFGGAIGDKFTGFLQALLDPSIILVAHNALFEQVITRNVFAVKDMYSKSSKIRAIPVSRWICTAALSSALALPRKLEGVASALKLSVQKDEAGHKLMKKWCKPRKASKKDTNTRHSDPLEYARLMDYCRTDVAVETELFLLLPPLSPVERKVWELDQIINLRGFNVDRTLVKNVLAMVDEETKALDAETEELTYGYLTTTKKVAKVLDYLRLEKVVLPDLTAPTVEKALTVELPETAKRLLEIRASVSMASTAKYKVFELRSRHDGRLRDILVYHRASTGRWGGAGIQPQNFPRGTIKNTTKASEILAEGSLDLVRMFYKNPMQVFSSCLRNMIIPSKGAVFDVADYAGIEVRVLFWAAGHKDGIRAFVEGRDLYKELASKIYGCPLDTINESQRFLGKGAVLGCGFSMGVDKFQVTCAKQGNPVSRELADAAVKTYRTEHAPVVVLWRALEKAAISAVQQPGKSFTAGPTKWTASGGTRPFLWCLLPSGRRLAYAYPSVVHEPSPWGNGDPRPVLYHYGEDAVTRKWVNAKTYGGKLTENVIQAIARDLMAEAMLQIEDAGPWRIVLSVHDELIAERPIDAKWANLQQFCQLMANIPAWASGCPVKAEGWSGDRYQKGRATHSASAATHHADRAKDHHFHPLPGLNCSM
jgi:DNA polymerase